MWRRIYFQCRSLLKLCLEPLPDLVFVAFLTGIFAHVPVLGIDVPPVSWVCKCVYTHANTVGGDSVAFSVCTFDHKHWRVCCHFCVSTAEETVFPVCHLCGEAGDRGRVLRVPLGQRLRDQPVQQPLHWLHVMAEGRPERPTEQCNPPPHRSSGAALLPPVIQAPLFHLENEKNGSFLHVSNSFSALLFACSSA